MPFLRFYNLRLLKDDIRVLCEIISKNKYINNELYKKIELLLSISILFEILCSLSYLYFNISNEELEQIRRDRKVLISNRRFYDRVRDSLNINDAESFYELGNIRNKISHSLAECVDMDYNLFISAINTENLKQIIKLSLDKSKADEECYKIIELIDVLFNK